MSDGGRWGGRLILAGLAILTGAFARRTYDVKVRQVGRRFEAGEHTLRGGAFACDGCGARFSLVAGDTLPACPECGGSYSTKIG